MMYNRHFIIYMSIIYEVFRNRKEIIHFSKPALTIISNKKLAEYAPTPQKGARYESKTRIPTYNSNFRQDRTPKDRPPGAPDDNPAATGSDKTDERKRNQGHFREGAIRPG